MIAFHFIIQALRGTRFSFYLFAKKEKPMPVTFHLHLNQQLLEKRESWELQLPRSNKIWTREVGFPYFVPYCNILLHERLRRFVKVTV